MYIDFTSRCNAMCLRCSRNINGKYVNPNMPLIDMDTKTFKNFFEQQILDQVDVLNFCGAYGEPIINPNLFNCLTYLFENINVERRRNFGTKYDYPLIKISTNGGLQKPDFWKKLAEFFNYYSPHSYVVFSIDGLSNTNHIYRRNVNWDKLIENVKTFINHGGRAWWQFISFDHNHHQINDAKNYSKELGFEKFFLKKSHHSFHAFKRKEKNYFNKSEHEGSETKKYGEIGINQKDKDLDNIYNHIKNDENYIDKTPIYCQFKKIGSLHLQFDGEVWPCSLIPGWQRFHHKKHPNTNDNELYRKVMSKYKENFNNINYYTLDEILNHEFFSKYMEESWSNDTDDNNYFSRLSKCATSCGEHVNMIDIEKHG